MSTIWPCWSLVCCTSAPKLENRFEYNEVSKKNVRIHHQCHEYVYAVNSELLSSKLQTHQTNIFCRLHAKIRPFTPKKYKLILNNKDLPKPLLCTCYVSRPNILSTHTMLNTLHSAHALHIIIIYMIHKLYVCEPKLANKPNYSISFYQYQ